MAEADGSSQTENNQLEPIKKPAINGKPFVAGYDSRRHLDGPNPIVTNIKHYIQSRLASPSLNYPNLSKLDEIVEKMVQRANDGDIKAMELALAYGFGRPSQQIDVTAQIAVQQIKIIRSDDIQDAEIIT